MSQAGKSSEYEDRGINRSVGDAVMDVIDKVIELAPFILGLIIDPILAGLLYWLIAKDRA